MSKKLILDPFLEMKRRKVKNMEIILVISLDSRKFLPSQWKAPLGMGGFSITFHNHELKK